MSLILNLLALEDTEDVAIKDAFVASVGALLRARTVDTRGVEVGTFTDITNPTYDQVLELMDQAARDIDTEISPDLIDFPRPETIKPLARSLLVLRTAMLIELDFPDSPVYDRLEKTYDKRLPSLVKASEQAGDGDQPGSADDELMPVYSFPTLPVGVELPAPTYWNGW